MIEREKEVVANGCTFDFVEDRHGKRLSISDIDFVECSYDASFVSVWGDDIEILYNELKEFLGK